MHLELRFFKPQDTKLLFYVIKYIENFNFRSFQIIIQNNNYTLELIKKMFRLSNTLISVTVCNCSNTLDLNLSGRRIIFTKDKVLDANHCGFVHSSYFNLDKTNFLIGKEYNSCLYGKISIDEFGNIKNCPAFKNSYGNIDEDSLNQIIKYNKSFYNSWLLKKDNINECKECELRYICSDCRAFTKNNTLDSRPLNCNYEI